MVIYLSAKSPSMVNCEQYTIVQLLLITLIKSKKQKNFVKSITHLPTVSKANQKLNMKFLRRTLHKHLNITQFFLNCIEVNHIFVLSPQVLGREVYNSNNQLGGVQIMHNNGVTHTTVCDDFEGVYTLLHWLSYTPKVC